MWSVIDSLRNFSGTSYSATEELVMLLLSIELLLFKWESRKHGSRLSEDGTPCSNINGISRASAVEGWHWRVWYICRQTLSDSHFVVVRAHELPFTGFERFRLLVELVWASPSGPYRLVEEFHFGAIRRRNRRWSELPSWIIDDVFFYGVVLNCLWFAGEVEYLFYSGRRGEKGWELWQVFRAITIFYFLLDKFHEFIVR